MCNLILQNNRHISNQNVIKTFFFIDLAGNTFEVSKEKTFLS